MEFGSRAGGSPCRSPDDRLGLIGSAHVFGSASVVAMGDERAWDGEGAGLAVVHVRVSSRVVVAFGSERLVPARRGVADRAHDGRADLVLDQCCRGVCRRLGPPSSRARHAGGIFRRGDGVVDAVDRTLAAIPHTAISRAMSLVGLGCFAALAGAGLVFAGWACAGPASGG